MKNSSYLRSYDDKLIEFILFKELKQYQNDSKKGRNW